MIIQPLSYDLMNDYFHIFVHCLHFGTHLGEGPDASAGSGVRWSGSPQNGVGLDPSCADGILGNTIADLMCSQNKWEGVKETHNMTVKIVKKIYK